MLHLIGSPQTPMYVCMCVCWLHFTKEKGGAWALAQCHLVCKEPSWGLNAGHLPVEPTLLISTLLGRTNRALTGGPFSSGSASSFKGSLDLNPGLPGTVLMLDTQLGLHLSQPCGDEINPDGSVREEVPSTAGWVVGVDHSSVRDRCFGTEGSSLSWVRSGGVLRYLLVHSKQKEQLVQSDMCLSPDRIWTSLPELQL